MHEQSIFLEALNLDRVQRSAYLSDVCAGRPDLRKRLEGLFDAHDNAAGFMEHPAQLAGWTPSGTRADLVETVLGPYRLVEQIGEGGFGIVFRAEQIEPIRREVAVKIIKPGMDTSHVIARFEAERHVLALMDHPNIARVLDAGTTPTCRPYFVMELVRGFPITDYCDRHRLTVQERLALFITVCRAVQHAHQKGIIHRDLKPSNVLVAAQDGDPVVKVIDFGVAKAIREPLTDHTVVPGGLPIVGTPLYISPEQARLDVNDVDTRSDVYSLGALLYELLCGATLFDRRRLRDAPFDEISRIIREEDPPVPSARSAAQEEIAETAALRRVDGRKLSATLRGELDWIVSKAIEKDRSRRYITAAALAEDCENFLRNRTVSAHPPSALYRLRKLSRRYKFALVTAALVLTALLAGGILAAWQAVRATRAEVLAQNRLEAEILARHDADANFQKAQQVVDEYLTRVSESKLLDVPGLQPLRKELLAAARTYYEQFVGQEGTDSEAQANLAAGYLRLAQVCNALDDNDDAVRFLGQGLGLVASLQESGAKSRVLYRRLGGVYLGGRGLHRGTRQPSDPKRALETLEQGVALWSKFVHDEPASPALRNDLAGFQLVLGNLLRGLRRLNAALPTLQGAASLWSALCVDAPENPEYCANLARCQGFISDVYRRLGRREECAAAFARMLELQESLVRTHPLISDYRLELALALTDGGRTALEADDLQKSKGMLERSRNLLEGLASESSLTPVYLESLAIICETQADLYRRLLDFTNAEICYRRGLSRLEMLVQFFPKLTRYRQELAADYRETSFFLLAVHRIDDAETAYRMALDNCEQLTVDEPGRSEHMRRFGSCLAASPFQGLQDNDRALTYAEEGVRLSHRDASCWETLGLVQIRLGRFDEAAKSLEKSAKLNGSENGFRDVLLAIACHKLGKIEDAVRSYDRAVAWATARRSHPAELDYFLAEAGQILGKTQGKKSVPASVRTGNEKSK